MHTCNKCEEYCGSLDNLQKHVACCMVDSDASDEECSLKTNGNEETVDNVNDEYVGVGDPVHSPVPVGSKHAGPVRRASSRVRKHSRCWHMRSV